jgi:hypothetical protein
MQTNVSQKPDASIITAVAAKTSNLNLTARCQRFRCALWIGPASRKGRPTLLPECDLAKNLIVLSSSVEWLRDALIYGDLPSKISSYRSNLQSTVQQPLGKNFGRKFHSRCCSRLKFCSSENSVHHFFNPAGPIKENCTWTSRYNHKLYKLYNEPDTVTVIKAGRLRWLGQLFRIQEQNPCRKLTLHKPEITRRAGRPAIRWLDSVEDLKGVRN